MINNDIIEEHPTNEPSSWVSNAFIVPKSDGSMTVTLNSRIVNKAIIGTNHPIQRQEDIKAILAGRKIFSKMDFKSAFWQIELDGLLRDLKVFHSNNKFFRYKRFTMVIKPAQGELNVALKLIFANTDNMRLIHDDLIIATTTMRKHTQTICYVMEAISAAHLTLNPDKCTFPSNKIHLWGMILSADGMQPDPAKVDALNFISAPTNDFISLLCMIQSNSNFIKNFSQIAAPLKELTQRNAFFEWIPKYTKTVLGI